MTAAQNAALYERGSTPGQATAGTSLGIHGATCRAHATKRGYHALKEHICREVHTGAAVTVRLRLTELRAALRQHHVRAIGASV